MALDAVIDGLRTLVLLVASFCFIGLISMPLQGAAVRLRAHYAPIQRSAHGGGGGGGSNQSAGQALLNDLEAPAAGQSLFLDIVRRLIGRDLRQLLGMMVRTVRIEGWVGLYKGIWPSIISSVFVSALFIILVEGSNALVPKGSYKIPDVNGLSLVLLIISITLVTLPLNLISTRAITTLHRLPFSPFDSFLYAHHLFFTPQERANPLRLYFIPGLFSATLLHATWTTAIAQVIRMLVVPELANGWLKPPDSPRDGPFAFIRAKRMVLFLVVQAVTAIVLAPLETLLVRTSIPTSPPSSSASSSSSPSLQMPHDHPVIHLRTTAEYEHDHRPAYGGLFDGARTVVREEGAGRLWTAWRVTALGAMLGALA